MYLLHIFDLIHSFNTIFESIIHIYYTFMFNISDNYFSLNKL